MLARADCLEQVVYSETNGIAALALPASGGTSKLPPAKHYRAWCSAPDILVCVVPGHVCAHEHISRHLRVRGQHTQARTGQARRRHAADFRTGATRVCPGPGAVLTILAVGGRFVHRRVGDDNRQLDAITTRPAHGDFDADAAF